MQLYALDSQQRLVFAEKAIKQQDYICLECQKVVRRRGGMHRHDHFYHLAPSQTCRQNGKSMIHLQIQSHLQQLLPYNECILEQRFPAINRIADVVWQSQKLVFEIQCSPISAAELQARNQDYLSQGYQVVWLLHDKRYNQWRLSAAEQSVRTGPYYFTTIDEAGRIIFYDQFDIIEKGIRKKVLGPLEITISQPLRISESTTQQLSAPHPQILMERLSKWPIHFSGDLIDTSIDPDYLNKIHEAEKEFTSAKPAAISWWRQLIRTPIHLYKLCLQILLERACR